MNLKSGSELISELPTGKDQREDEHLTRMVLLIYSKFKCRLK